MTQHEAKELSLEVWRYLADHPEIKRKHELPKNIFSKISHLQNKCHLCEIFMFGISCGNCPLDCMKKDHGTSYEKYYNAESEEARKKAAQAIVDAIEAWEPEEQ